VPGWGGDPLPPPARWRRASSSGAVSQASRMARVSRNASIPYRPYSRPTPEYLNPGLDVEREIRAVEAESNPGQSNDDTAQNCCLTEFQQLTKEVVETLF